MPLASPASAELYFARYALAPDVKLIPRRIMEFLSKIKGGEYPLCRMQAEQGQLDGDDAESDAVEMRLFKLSEAESQLSYGADRNNVRVSSDGTLRNAGPAQDNSLELEEIRRQKAICLAKKSALSSKSGPLNKRLTAQKRLITEAIGGGKYEFKPPVRAEGKLSVVRENIVGCYDEIARIEKAPVTLAETKDCLTRWINETKREIHVSPLFDPDPLIRHSPYVPLTVLPGMANNHVESPDMLGIFVGMFQDQIFERLSAALERCSARDDDAAVSTDDKVKKIAQCKDKLLSLERQEAAIEWKLMQAGEFPDLRQDANPLAILSMHKL